MRHYRDPLYAAALMAVLLGVFAWFWFAFLPDADGHLDVDYSIWLPNLLAGYYWYLHNGLFSLPWFSPYQCAGVPFQADPELGYLSLPQLLTIVTDPLNAIRATWILYGAAGFWGAWVLARRGFGVSGAASLLAAALFLMNGMFGSRLAVGHLSFAPFMLVPAVCAAIVQRPAGRPGDVTGFVARAVVCGVLLAIPIQGGMTVMLPQFLFTVGLVALLHAACFGGLAAACARLAAGLALALALCAGKLVATADLLANFPRTDYPLPGIEGAFTVLYVAARALFWPGATDLGHFVAYTRILMEPHEFAYGIGLAPPALLLGALALAVGTGGLRALVPARRWIAVALAVGLIVPVVINLYTPGWNGLLKSLPLLGSSSNLFRWFAVLMLPAIIGAALALDRLAAVHARRAWLLAGVGLAVTLGGLAGVDTTPYGPPIMAPTIPVPSPRPGTPRTPPATRRRLPRSCNYSRRTMPL